MDLVVLLNAFGAIGALAFITEMIRMILNRKKSSLEVRQLESQLVVTERDSAMVVLERVNSTLERQAARQQERIMYLELQLESRDSKIESLSGRLEVLMSELTDMQSELRDLRDQGGRSERR